MKYNENKTMMGERAKIYGKTESCLVISQVQRSLKQGNKLLVIAFFFSQATSF